MADEYICKQDAIDALDRIFDNVPLELTTEILRLRRELRALPSADVVQVVRCKDCIHNNDCDIQYSAQAGENFFCGFGETEKDVREDVYE